MAANDPLPDMTDADAQAARELNESHEAVGWDPTDAAPVPTDTAREAEPLHEATPTTITIHSADVAEPAPAGQLAEPQVTTDDAAAAEVPYTGEAAAEAEAEGQAEADAAAEAQGAAPMADGPDARRREFLKKVLAISAGTVAIGVPVAAGVRVFLDPLTRKGEGDGGTVVNVAPLDAVPPDGVPRRFQVVADKTDAWNHYLNVPIGAVYLVRHADRPQEVTAFNVVCPHAGCAVEARADGTFACPCHRSTFRADGSLVPGSVSPRGLDQLKVDPAAVAKGDIKIRFQNFMAGTAERIPVG